MTRTRRVIFHRVPLSRRGRRGGTALVMAIICLTLTSAMGISLVRLALVSHHQAERGQWLLQSAWLAESGLVRAMAQLNADPDYTGEKWTIADIGPRHDQASVNIEVTADKEDDSLVTITATADFPADPIDRVRSSRTMTLRRGEPSSASAPSEE